jgi:hypothetical protein
MALSSKSRPLRSADRPRGDAVVGPDQILTCPEPSYPVIALQVLATSGYGIWMLLGMALALGIYRDGRSEGLLPLTLGAIFASLGLLMACLRLPWVGEWHGWRPARSSWPTREALLALSTYLPMLAVAGLVRGDNDFWATRLAGAALMLCSLGSLAYTVRSFCSRLSAEAQQHSRRLPASRVVTAWYGGGLWLWLCLISQDASPHPAGTRPWIMAVLLLALLLGLLEGMRWQTLQMPVPRLADGRPHSHRPARFVAALFTYAVPSVALLLIDLFDAGTWLVGVAAVSCLVGKTLEQHAYEGALAERLARA